MPGQRVGLLILRPLPIIRRLYDTSGIAHHIDLLPQHVISLIPFRFRFLIGTASDKQ
jgi:hypothetical protein